MNSGTVILQSNLNPSEQEQLLAERLSLPLVPNAQLTADDGIRFYLQLLPAGLSLVIVEERAPGPLTIDFTSTKLLRRSRDSIVKQDLGKALGLNRHPGQRILDATAGTGTDAFLMAVAGCTVTLLERSKIVHALLSNALARAASAESSVATAINRMCLQCADFLHFDCEGAQYDVVYLDPMFPEDTGSARSGKAMYMLKQLLGKGDDESQLLARGLDLATRRVVVKRNRKSPRIPGPDPDIQFKGSSSRYDVYLLQSI